jgi:twitching motility protein PilT
MKPIAELLRHLTRPGVTELVLVSGRCAMVKTGAGYEAVDDAVLTVADLAQALKGTVGPARVAAVGEQPVHWTLRAEGVGNIAIGAVRRGNVLNVRVLRTDAPAASAQAGAAPAGAARQAQAPAAGAQARPPARPAAPAGSAPAAGASQAPAPTAGRAGIQLSRNLTVLPTQKPTGPTLTAAEPEGQHELPNVSAAPVVEQDQSKAKPDFWRTLPGLLEEARRLRASDLHVIAARPALFRIVGELYPFGEVVPPKVAEDMLMEMVPERLKPVLAKTGSCDFALELPGLGRFRVNVGRQRTGFKGTFRVIAMETPTLASLGLPAEIARACHHHQGLIVVTGPSGHGKTSTLAAIVDILNRETSHHILTVEDPVEYLHPRKKALMSQREVGTHTRTFASALKGSLREDPDVIVVGELRDTETVRMALSAAETGHLLISTMNTPSAAKTIDRLIDLFPPGDQAQVRLSLSSGLRLIVGQRLLPGVDGKVLVAAAELLPGSVALGNLIRDNKTFQIPSLQQRGKGLGIVRFDDSLAELVKAGKVALEVARGFAESPDELEAVVTGKRPGAPPEPPPGEGGRPLLGKMGSLLKDMKDKRSA